MVFPSPPIFVVRICCFCDKPFSVSRSYRRSSRKWVSRCNAQAMALVFLFVSLIDSPKPLYLFTVSHFAPSILNSFNSINGTLPLIRISFPVPAYHWNRFKSARKNQRMMVLCSVDDRSNNLGSQRKRFLSLIAVALSIFHLSSSEFPLSMTVLISCRKIVEHVCLLKANKKRE